MSYYPAMNHHHMLPNIPSRYPPPSFPPPNLPTNRFIYVKHNFSNPPPPPTPKVLVNPHFKKKVFVNPQFKLPQILPTVKPKIHVNPNVLKNFGKNVPTVDPQPAKSVETKPVTVISTRNKLVRIPCNPTSPVVRKRRNSLHTKYKIVRSSGAKTPVNKFKLDKREKIVNKSISKSIKKKYVYVNRFLSMDVMAKNVLLKNSNLCKPGFVNINGILYKKSPNSLKRASDSFNKTKSAVRSQSSFKRASNSVLSASKYKLVRRDSKQLLNSTIRRSLVKRHKLIRSTKVPPTKLTPSKMRKCNIPCPIFRKYGKCPRKDSGKCFKVHNPDQIVLCTRFLQGACRNENCLLSHKVSLEKMPTCKYYLEGLCSKDDCPYLHVKISPKAEICRDFLEGFCKKGAQCEKRHQFLCPDFEKNKKCEKRRCPYPHGNVVRKNKVLNMHMLAKKCSAKKEKRKKIVKQGVVNELLEKNRYYKDSAKESGEDPVIKTISRERPKLGQLPAFIPFFEGT